MPNMFSLFVLLICDGASVDVEVVDVVVEEEVDDVVVVLDVDVVNVVLAVGVAVGHFPHAFLQFMCM